MSAITDHLIVDLIERHDRPYDMHGEFSRVLRPTRPGISATLKRPVASPPRAMELRMEAAMRCESDRRLTRLKSVGHGEAGKRPTTHQSVKGDADAKENHGFSDGNDNRSDFGRDDD